MSQRKIAILSICAAWFAVLCVILLGFIIGKHLVVLIIFSAISAFFVTLTWAIRLRNSSVHWADYPLIGGSSASTQPDSATTWSACSRIWVSSMVSIRVIRPHLTFVNWNAVLLYNSPLGRSPLTKDLTATRVFHGHPLITTSWTSNRMPGSSRKTRSHHSLMASLEVLRPPNACVPWKT